MRLPVLAVIMLMALALALVSCDGPQVVAPRTATEGPTGTSSGGETKGPSAVPNVIMMTEAEAVSTLGSLGFASDVSYLQAMSEEDGMVIVQDPSAGTTASAGSTVHLQVGVWEEPTTVVLPNVIMMTEAEAVSTLSLLGLTSDVSYYPAMSEEDGMVIVQDPSAGAWVEKGNTVHLQVGVWEEPTVFKPGAGNIPMVTITTTTVFKPGAGNIPMVTIP